MKKSALLVAICFAGIANAQFIDERRTAPVATAAPMLPMAPGVMRPVNQIAEQAGNPVIPATVWTVNPVDLRIADALVRWGRMAGYQVRWDASKHFLVDGAQSFTGTFEAAVEDLLSSPGIRNSDYPLEVCFYPNNPTLARITRQGVQTKDCR